MVDLGMVLALLVKRNGEYYKDRYIRFAKEMWISHPTLAKTVTRIINHPNSNKWLDLHVGNIMQRKDGTPVITDPWAG